VPIYEYKCENGHVFDVIQKFTDEPLTECQECGAPAVRVLHSPAIHFKGSGFHNTDYGRGKAAGASSDGGNGSSEGSGESKPSDSSSSDPKPAADKAKATAD
jgi:putative FmdB family regulatory protein